MTRHLKPLTQQSGPTAPTTSVPAVIPLAVAASLSAFLLSRGFPPGLEVASLLLLTMVAAVLLARSMLVPLLLFLVQLVLFAAEFSALRHSIDALDRIVAGCLLVLLLSTLRYLQLPEPAALIRFCTEVREALHIPSWLKLTRTTASEDATTWHSSPASSEFLLIGVRVLIAVLLASWLLEFVPNNPQAPADVALIPTAQRTIRLGLSFVIATIAIRTILNSAAWRRMSPAAARLFLKTELSAWCGRELQSVMRQEERQKRGRR
ncbi:MAG: hypothetical protein ACYTGL_26945 [Planctomycetota bacterium]|jgi:hypothetical protein